VEKNIGYGEPNKGKKKPSQGELFLHEEAYWNGGGGERNELNDRTGEKNVTSKAMFSSRSIRCIPEKGGVRS